MEKAPVGDKIKRLCRYFWSSLPGFINKSKKEWYIDYAMVLGQSILGGEAFIAWVKERCIDGMKGPEIGGLFGIDYGPVSQERKRLREKLANDRKLRALMSRIGGILSLNGRNPGLP